MTAPGEEIKTDKTNGSLLAVTKTEVGLDERDDNLDESQNWYEVRMFGKLPERRSYHVGVIHNDR